MSETTTASRFMTTAELAALVRKSPATVRAWRHRGQGPRGTKVGRGVLYRRDAVEAWLQQREEADEIGRRAIA
ncbi:helix-turn-helix transcriptional regulator [Streptomyces albogriseolus]|uniref:helix-turn-helix transcriptional regulator n=1 Tax=Streptomyces albogriseolus TaxID=1887 RepID=UPI00224E56C0|nr:helix-turn-helix domain-containing protein [Streptomyces viridodiastaticus]MCX4622839.1 helix-turn-helix domain-containing protein [Streptomyces viridodiastaticus]